MKTELTKGEWKQNPREPLLIQSATEDICVVTDGLRADNIKGGRNTGATSRANAELICKAVNNYNKMVEMLLELDSVCDIPPDTSKKLAHLIAKLHTAKQ